MTQAEQSSEPRPRGARLILVLIALTSILILGGVVVPRFLINDSLEQWSGPQREAAQLATNRVRHGGGLFQKLTRIEVRAVEIHPDADDCDWGHARRATGIVTVQTYTFFGIPAERWTVTCQTESRVSD